MMSALECYQKAAHCEAMARQCADPFDVRMLQETAVHWRNLARTAKDFGREGCEMEPLRAEAQVPEPDDRPLQNM